MSNSEGPIAEVIKTCDECKFIGMNYRCYHADAPVDNVLEYDYEKAYTPNWCPVDKHEMVAVRKDDLEVLFDYASGVYSEWFEPDGKAEVIERVIKMLSHK